jgi:hypothetical protein
MGSTYFFALKEDLLPLLELVESKGPLRYTLTGNFLKKELTNGISAFNTGAEIPRLGMASGDSSTICDRYLVTESEIGVNLREFQGYDGDRVCLDQLVNPDSVVFLAGGLWIDDVVIQGYVGTASDSQISKGLMKRFRAAMKKHFKKVKAFNVGPRAMTMLESGKRLTASARSPREYDLAI